MAVRAHFATVRRDVLRFDRSQLQLVIAVRNAIGVVIPLAIGVIAGHELAGLTASVGAIQVAMSDRPEPFRFKIGRMFLASVVSALAVFAGSATGDIAWLAVAITMIWGFAGGLLMALDPDAGPFALAGIVLVIVMANQPHDPGRAAQLAGLVLLGGALQTVLAIVPLSMRRLQAERMALADLARQLAEYARGRPEPTAPPPATAELEMAHRLIGSLRGSHDPEVENLRTLLNQLERIRAELVALATSPAEPAAAHLDEAAAALESIAGVLSGEETGRFAAQSPHPAAAQPPSPNSGRGYARMSPLCPSPKEKPPSPRIGRGGLGGEGASDLTAQLRAAGRIASEIAQQSTTVLFPTELHLPWRLRLHSPLPTLRANLSLHSAALRHAIRLAICLGIADTAARAFNLPRGYWLPMTVAIVLRPDFTTTFERGIARIVGTALGLVLATGLIHLIFAGQWEQIALIGLLFFFVRIFGPTNYGLLSIAITGLIVVLLSFAGAPPGPTMADRGANTLLGGLLALLAFLAWPTWERRRVPGVLADLLVAYRDYFQAVMSAYLGPTPLKSTKLTATRLAARLARSNAEVSVDRLQSEPVGSEAEVERALAILAASHRFVVSALALEADLQRAPRPAAVGPLLRFADQVTTTLDWLAQAVRNGTPPASSLPDLRATQRRLVDGGNETEMAAGPLTSEIDRIVNSLSMLTAVIAPSADKPATTASATAPPTPVRPPESAG